MNSLEELLKKMLHMFEERDWLKFHSPKNVAMNLSVEAAEVLEHFQWLSEEESRNLDQKTREKVKEEIGDVFIVLLHLAHKLSINPLEAAKEKLCKIDKRYPVEKCKGKNFKYTAYVSEEN